MAEVRLFVGYPHPTDAAAFEKAYAEGHIPMAGPILAGAGATKAVLTRPADTPAGKPHFYRIAEIHSEIHFPPLETLSTALGSAEVPRTVADANRISTGRPVVAIISGEEQTVAF